MTTQETDSKSHDGGRFPYAASAWSVGVVLAASFGFVAALIDLMVAAFEHVWIGVAVLVGQAAVGSTVIAGSRRTGPRGVGIGLAITACLGLVWMLAGALGAFG